jgi:hypothetical protein
LTPSESSFDEPQFKKTKSPIPLRAAVCFGQAQVLAFPWTPRFFWSGEPNKYQ